MTAISKNAVVQAFLSDHKHFMQLLKHTTEALAAHDLESAKSNAKELNAVAGPHIAFEETVLYPALDNRTHERSFVEQLYKEHREIVDAVEELIECETMSSARIDELHNAFVDGLEHADHCGTLVSNLSAMDEGEQSDALDELKQLRVRKLKWTDLKKE